MKGFRARVNVKSRCFVPIWIGILLAFFICSPKTARAQDSLQYANVDGTLRSYLIHLPIDYEATHKYPLVIVLHGNDQTAEDMARLSRFDFAADRYGFIAFFPNSDDVHWDVGEAAAPAKHPDRRGGGLGELGLHMPFPLPGAESAPKSDSQHKDELGDVKFFNQMLDKLEATYSVDPDRIFATGYSDGGIMDFRLGCSMSGRIAAIAPIAAAMPKEMSLGCKISRSVPLLMINGTSDPIVRYVGGQLKEDGLTTLPVKATAEKWAELDRCTPKPAETELPSHNKNGMKTILNTYSDCRDGVQVSLYTIEGAGNTWPSGYEILPEKEVGKTSTDLDADDIIWKFFSTHPMRPLSSSGN